MPSEKLAYRIDEACRAIGIGRSKLYELNREGKIKIVRLGGRSVVPVTELRALLEREAA
ncbi:helix-turn-helix domain-containing protein [Porphyrobacter algicida]|uniref:Helix-turn-helix domain-containing protein n=2 Tax=Qipengyuania algicida TaxID=1836209 RepID=A0A845AES4_9SPHN|nr:helix-turn-helix domain-containing protein [Qipengyuania algicida]